MFRKLLIAVGLSGLGSIVGCSVARMAEAAQPTAAADNSKPTTEDAIVQRLADLEREFVEKKRGSCITLGDRAFDDIREDSRFRALIRRHVDTAESWMLPEDEPGERLLIEGAICGADGKPVEGALIYAYQTDRSGVYSRMHGNNTASMGDSLNPRIFTYVRTKSDGRYGLMTIRPGGYPGQGPPAHIHYEIEAPGFKKLVTEVMFSDDKRLTPDTRRWVEDAGFVICNPRQDERNRQHCTADFALNPL